MEDYVITFDKHGNKKPYLVKLNGATPTAYGLQDVLTVSNIANRDIKLTSADGSNTLAYTNHGILFQRITGDQKGGYIADNGIEFGHLEGTTSVSDCAIDTTNKKLINIQANYEQMANKPFNATHTQMETIINDKMGKLYIHNVYITGVYDDNEKDFTMCLQFISTSNQNLTSYQDLYEYLELKEYESFMHFLSGNGISPDSDILFGLYIDSEYIRVVYNNGGQFGGYYVYKDASYNFTIEDKVNEL